MADIRADQIRLLERLCTAVAVSGDEAEVREIVLEELTGSVDDLRVDALGNVLAVRHSRRRNAPRVMLDAHMDEVGFMIVADDGAGLFQFAVVGGIRPRYLPGKPVVVGRNHRRGVIGATPAHLTEAQERAEYDPRTLRVDLGIGGTAAIGERAAFATKFRRSGSALLAKSIDNRIGVATLIELVRTAPPNVELCAAFTTQEEIGSMGAAAATHALNPDLAIVIEATIARDLPEASSAERASYNTRLGLGPAIYVADRATVYDERIVQLLEATAKRRGVPFQRRQPGGGVTDGRAIQRALEGIPCAAVAVPHRYGHSPLSIARLDDWSATLRLLSAALRAMTPAWAAGLRVRRKPVPRKAGRKTTGPAPRTGRRRHRRS